MYDIVKMHFDDVFVIYSNNFEYGVSCFDDQIYFEEEDAQKQADELNKTCPSCKYEVATLTEYVERYGEGKHDEGEGVPRASMSFND